MIQRVFTALGALLLATTLPAQTVTVPGRGLVFPLVTLDQGHSVGGLDVDASGNLFYLDVDGSGGTTHLYERSAAGVKTDLFDIGATGIYGVFVRQNAGHLYLSYATFAGSYTFVTGTLGSAGQMLQSASSRALGVAAYDLAFNATGTAFLSANPNSSAGNHVYQFDPVTLSLVSKVSIPQDYSGPLTFDPAGNLLYGTTSGDVTPGKGIYRIPKNTLTGSEVTLDTTFRLQINTGNGYFADGGGNLYDATYSSTLGGYTQDGAGSFFTAATANDFLSFSNLAYGAGQVYANVTDFGNGNYIFAIPEPGSAWLLVAAAGLCARRRRR